MIQIPWKGYFCRVVLESEEVISLKQAQVYYRNPRGNNQREVKDWEGALSLYKSYSLCDQKLLESDPSHSSKVAVSYLYAGFVYRFYNLYPELSRNCERRIHELGFREIPIFPNGNFEILKKIMD